MYIRSKKKKAVHGENPAIPRYPSSGGTSYYSALLTNFDIEIMSQQSKAKIASAYYSLPSIGSTCSIYGWYKEVAARIRGPSLSALPRSTPRKGKQ